MTTHSVDVLVVGAGPAGLFTALEIVTRSSLRVAVIDAGADVEDRTRPQSRAGKDHRVWGVGGAGLFSDGKLCLSLGVGGELGAIVSEQVRAELLLRVADRLRATAALGTTAPPARAKAAQDAGLDFVYYPVFHVGSEQCADAIQDVRDAVVEAGGVIYARSELKDLVRELSDYRAVIRQDGRTQQVRARRVVLAMGKVGAARQAEICRSVGAGVSPLPMYVGARLEADRSVLAPLFNGVVDPKYKLHFDDGSKIKLHCATDGGAVLPLNYDGFLLAGGHAYKATKLTRSSVGVLWNGLQVGNDALGCARSLMERAAAIAPSALVAQRLVDCVHGRASTAEEIAATRPSTSAWAAGDLRDVLPAEYFTRLDAFVERLSRLAPGLLDKSTVLFGPSVEWWMSRVETDESLQTAVDGLYVAGDGSGWSQGIVHAAATGLVVGDGIVRATAGDMGRGVEYAG